MISPNKKGLSRVERKILFWLLAAAVAATLLLGLLRMDRGGYGIAQIYCDGTLVASLDLADYQQSRIIPLSQLGVDLPVSFELKDHKIRFVNVTCPDHLCEGFGFVSLPTQTAVCMPNRVSVLIDGR